MKNRRERKALSAAPQVEPNLVMLINKMQQQLVSLESKIDALISRPPQRPFSKPPQTFDNRSGERKFFQVICADCNKQCEVPFRPSPGRPVYCKECFSRRKNSGNPFKARLPNDAKGGQAKQENRIIERDFTRQPRADKRQIDERQQAGKKKVLRKQKKRG